MANSLGELAGGKPLIKLGMVDWFNPAQLMRTAVHVIVSTTLGRPSDRRVIEALANSSDPQDFYDHTCAYKFNQDEEYS